MHFDSRNDDKNVYEMDDNFHVQPQSSIKVQNYNFNASFTNLIGSFMDVAAL